MINSRTPEGMLTKRISNLVNHSLQKISRDTYHKRFVDISELKLLRSDRENTIKKVLGEHGKDVLQDFEESLYGLLSESGLENVLGEFLTRAKKNNEAEEIKETLRVRVERVLEEVEKDGDASAAQKLSAMEKLLRLVDVIDKETVEVKVYDYAKCWPDEMENAYNELKKRSEVLEAMLVGGRVDQISAED